MTWMSNYIPRNTVDEIMVHVVIGFKPYEWTTALHAYAIQVTFRDTVKAQSMASSFQTNSDI